VASSLSPLSSDESWCVVMMIRVIVLRPKSDDDAMAETRLLTTRYNKTTSNSMTFQITVYQPPTLYIYKL